MSDSNRISLIGRYRSAGYEAVADGVMAFFDRRTDLHRAGIAFGPSDDQEPSKLSTDISLVAIDLARIRSPAPSRR